MASNSAGAYDAFLGRDASESRRLNIQHDVLKGSFGGLLHPAVQDLVRSGSPTAFADLATGTCIFLAEIAHEVPSSCQLDGFDISDAQFPARSQLPPNVTPRVLNSMAPVPRDLQNKYDVVFIRYLGLALVSEKEYRIVAENARSMLKPGGLIQWLEPNFWQASRPLLADPNDTDTLPSELQARFAPYRPQFEFADTELENVLQSVFGEFVSHQVVSTDVNPASRTSWTQMMYSTYEFALSRVEAAKGKEGLSEEKVKSLVDRLRLKGEGMYVRFDLHRHVARKA